MEKWKGRNSEKKKLKVIKIIFKCYFNFLYKDYRIRKYMGDVWLLKTTTKKKVLKKMNFLYLI